MARATAAVIDAADVTADDLAAGYAFENAGRTITEADVVLFAGLTGDYNRQHVNQHWAVDNSVFGGRIAHGLLFSSIAIGMIPPRLKRALGPMREATSVYKRPVLLGDTIRISGRLLDRESDGWAPLECRVLNQRDETVTRHKLHFGPRIGDPALPAWPAEPVDSLELKLAQVLEGRPYRTPGRTLTEAHVVGFSCLTGDWHEPYANAEWARTHGPGERVIQEMLIPALAAPMNPLDVSRLVAARKAHTSWHRPALLGDTMYVEGRVVESHPAADGFLQLAYDYRAVNQHGQPLAALRMVLLMRDPGSPA